MLAGSDSGSHPPAPRTSLGRGSAGQGRGVGASGSEGRSTEGRRERGGAAVQERGAEDRAQGERGGRGFGVPKRGPGGQVGSRRAQEAREEGPQSKSQGWGRDRREGGPGGMSRGGLRWDNGPEDILVLSTPPPQAAVNRPRMENNDGGRVCMYMYMYTYVHVYMYMYILVLILCKSLIKDNTRREQISAQHPSTQAAVNQPRVENHEGGRVLVTT